MNTRSVEHRLGTIAVGLSTAVVLIALAILPFLTPAWVAFEQGRTGVAELVNPPRDILSFGCCRPFSTDDIRVATNAILNDLVAGGDFDVAVDGRRPVLTPPERAHMRDVRGVFGSVYLVAALAALILVITARATGRRAATWSRRDAWRAVRRGALGLAGTIAVAGVVAVVAFDAAFAVFHQLFFAQGNYLFDPRTSRLLQLFPDAFWFETSVVVGGVILILALATTWLAGRRMQVHARPASLGSSAARSGVDTATLTATDPEGAR